MACFFIDLKKHYFCNTSHYKSKDASFVVIYFAGVDGKDKRLKQLHVALSNGIKTI